MDHSGNILLPVTHWGRVTHIYVVKLTIIDSDNGLSPRRRQAIIWTNAGILLIEPLGTNFIEILIGIQTFSFKKMYLKMSSAKWRPFCLGLNALIIYIGQTHMNSMSIKWAKRSNSIPFQFSYVKAAIKCLIIAYDIKNYLRMALFSCIDNDWKHYRE